MKAERVEDLGRIREKLDKLLEYDLFNTPYYRKYQIEEHFKEHPEDLDILRLQIEHVNHTIAEIWEIACGDQDG